MPASTDQGAVDSIEEGQILPQQQQLYQQRARNLPPTEQRFTMDAQSNAQNNTSSYNRNIPQSGNPTSSSFRDQGQLAPTSDMPSSELKNPNDSAIGVTGAQNESTTTAPNTTPQNTSITPRGNGPRTDAPPEKQGYERKIGRGTSWRRDHKGHGEDEYYLRGRGRGTNPSSRGGGRGNFYRDQENRGYYRRDMDRPPLDPREVYPPEPYYESRGSYPGYDSRRDYPPESKFVDEYRRYESRDGPPPIPPLESRRPYDRGPLGRDDPFDGRPYPRPRDSRDDFRDEPRPPRDIERYPPEPNPRDLRPDSRSYDDRIPRLIDDPRMLPRPVEEWNREHLDYPLENIDPRRHSSIDRTYGRIASRNNDLPIKGESPIITKPEDKDSTASPLTVRRKEGGDAERESLGNGNRARLPSDTKIDTPPYNYPRDRPAHPDMYRDESAYGRGSYSNFGRGRGMAPDDIRSEPFYKRDPRDPYYVPYADPPTDYRSRDAYPPRALPPSDYRGAPYDERYAREMELDPRRGREGYRDLPPRSHEYGQKRKYDDPDYRDPYMDDYRAPDPRYPDRPDDYPRPPYDYDERDPKRARGPIDSRLPPPPFGRPPYDDREPTPRNDRPSTAPAASIRQGRPPPVRAQPKGRYFLAKTSTAENLAQSRETGRWGIPVKDVEVFREARKAGPVTLIFALDESGRFSGYAQMTSDVGSVSPMPWMEEHCNPVGAAFEVKHLTTDDVRTTTTAKSRNFLTEGKPIRFGHDGQEISAKEAVGLIEELERMSGPENAEKRANAVVARGRGRGRGRGSLNRGHFHYEGPRGRGRGRGD